MHKISVLECNNMASYSWLRFQQYDIKRKCQEFVAVPRQKPEEQFLFSTDVFNYKILLVISLERVVKIIPTSGGWAWRSPARDSRVTRTPSPKRSAAARAGPDSLAGGSPAVTSRPGTRPRCRASLSLGASEPRTRSLTDSEARLARRSSHGFHWHCQAGTPWALRLRLAATR